MWQDTVIAICQLAFLPAFLPTLFGSDKPALVTSGANAILVAIITISLASMQLWFSSITAGLISIIWAVLAIQKYQMRSKRRRK